MKKNIFLLTVLFVFINTILCAQNKKHCENPEETQLDLNSISKCSIEKNNNSSDENKVVLNVASKKVRKRIVRKREKVNSLDNSSNLGKEITSNNITIQNNIVKRKVISKEILFSVVDEVPLFPKCENSTNSKSDCFNNQFSKHFAKNFDPEQASEEGVTGRVFIQFTINVKGEVNNLFVKSRKKNLQLENEINRVIKNLPKFTPGKHNGLPVNVKYSLPINFSVD